MLDVLQKKFGTAQIKFSEGNGGLTKATIATSTGAAEIYLHGAHVTHFQPKGQQPVLYLSSASAFKADKPIRGGVPICWPWFGPSATDPKLPMHGFARTNEWAVESTRELDGDRASITLRLEPSDSIRAIWPHEFGLKYTVTVGAALELELEMTNRDKAGLLISEALHTYFSIGDIEKISLNGLTGTSYFDKVANARMLEERDPVKLSSETDCVYLNTRTAVGINDPVIGRKIRVEKAGSNSTVVWNPFEAKAKTMADIGAGEWRKYICIEAVNALENTVTVAPGATHKIGTTLKVMG
jgi:D-hexose-6-phosphate mutarotase